MAVIKSRKSIVRKNSAGSDITRRRVNLIEGSNVTLTVAEDTTDNEIDVTIAASGGITGPGSSTDNAIVRWDGAGGSTVQNSSLLIDDSGNVTGPAAGFKITGGTNTTADLTFQTTSGVGATGADMHFLVGNNGATEAMTILNNGNVGIGTTTPAGKLHTVTTSDTSPGATWDDRHFVVGQAGSNGAAVGISYNNTSGYGYINAIAPGVAWKSLALQTGGGGVGINTTTPPLSGLEVAGNIFMSGATAGFDIKDRATNVNSIELQSPTAGKLLIRDLANSADRITLDASGNIGIGTTGPTNLLSLGGNSARTVWMERHTTANTAGNSLTIQAGGATSAATDKNGGNLILAPGTATGDGSASVIIQTVAGSQGAGTTDRNPANTLTITSSATSPSTSDANALGTTSLMWSDLFLASGAVINFNNGDVTITHALNKITVAGGDLEVPDEAYDATNWNGSLGVPTKNAIRDKIETLSSSSCVAIVPLPASGAVTALNTVQYNVNTTAQGGAFVLPFAITVNKISIEVTAVGTAGTLDIGVYSENGQTKHFEVTTASISGTGVVTTAVSSVALSAGIYYVIVVSNSTADITLRSLATGPALQSVTSEPIFSGPITVSAGTLPATFNTSSDFTANGNYMPSIRLDN